MSQDILVFESSREGVHASGHAKAARLQYGAKTGYPEGPQGNAYAIVTKELRPWMPPVTLEEIKDGVDKFLAYAKAHPELLFRLTPIGCGLAGFKPAQIRPFFKKVPVNIVVPFEFL